MNSSKLTFHLSLYLLLCVRKVHYVFCSWEKRFFEEFMQCPGPDTSGSIREWCVLQALCCCVLTVLSFKPVMCRGSPWLLWTVFDLGQTVSSFNKVCSCLLFKWELTLLTLDLKPCRTLWLVNMVCTGVSDGLLGEEAPALGLKQAWLRMVGLPEHSALGLTVKQWGSECFHCFIQFLFKVYFA